MPDIKTETSELGQTSAQWASGAPSTPRTPPVALTAPADPITTAALTAVADWPIVHQNYTFTRATSATEFAGDNSSTITTFTEIEGDNTALINGRVEV